MKKLFAILFLFVITATYAQQSSLYIPLNIQKAYKNGTRAMDGKPGLNYWQNSSIYKIKAEIFPDSSELVGEATITYYNNSPDTLKNIVMRLYQDIFKKGAARDFPMNSKAITNGTDLKEMIINNDTMNVSPNSSEVRRTSTNMYVKLRKPLIPKSSIKIKVKWQFQIPSKMTLRMGNYGNGDMFISYWYPQISVYDDIDGWDRIEYEGIVEFYNDFSNYNVQLTVPKGYTIWATGNLINAEKVYQPKIYERYLQAKKSDKTIHIITTDDRKQHKVTAQNLLNTWNFKAKNVTDFSFAMSNNYVWDGASIEVDSTTGRRVLTDAVYKYGTINYNEAAQFARTTIQYLSNKLPGYSYPYPHITSFCNNRRGGGMETPMMTNDGAPTLRARTLELIFHEIAHSYFPFFMGINESKYAWMDEGWATFFPRNVLDRQEPKYDYWKRIVYRYESSAGYEAELPPMVVSYDNRGKYFGTDFYTRPGSAYRELEVLLGKTLFKKALKEYIIRWHGHHPIPLDFFNTFNRVSKQNLDWFWNPWFYDFGYPDLAIEKVKINNDNIIVLIKRIGNIPTRIKLIYKFADGSTQQSFFTAKVWKDGNKIFKIIIKSDKKLKSITLGGKYIPDVNKKNNIMKF